MNQSLKSVRPNETSIIYDGQCPFCCAYTNLLRLRDAIGPVSLIDAREHPDIITELKSLNLDLDEGMVVQYKNQIYFGSDALYILSALTTRSGFWNRFMVAIFGQKSLAHLLYPVLRSGRNLTLRIMNRQKINR